MNAVTAEYPVLVPRWCAAALMRCIGCQCRHRMVQPAPWCAAFVELAWAPVRGERRCVASDAGCRSDCAGSLHS